MSKIKIAVDFDGVCCEDQFPGIGSIKPNLIESLNQLKSYCEIIIYSARANLNLDNRDQLIEDMKEFLDFNQIPYDRIDDGREGKPMADIFIDDRAIPFENNWPEIAKAILSILSQK